MSANLELLFDSMKGAGPQDVLSVNLGADYDPKRLHVDVYRLASSLDRQLGKSASDDFDFDPSFGVAERLIKSSTQVIFLEGPRGTGKSLAMAVAEQKPYTERIRGKSAMLIDAYAFSRYFEGADQSDEDDLSLRFAKGLIGALMQYFERIDKLPFETAKTFISKFVKPAFETGAVGAVVTQEWRDKANQILEVIRSSPFIQALNVTTGANTPAAPESAAEISDRYKIKENLVHLLVEFLRIYKTAGITELVLLVDDYGELTSDVRFIILPKLIDYFRASCTLAGIRPYFRVAIYPDTAAFFYDVVNTAYLGSDLFYAKFRDEPMDVANAEFYWSAFFHHIFALRAYRFKLVSSRDIQLACRVTAFHDDKVLYDSCCRTIPLNTVFNMENRSADAFFAEFARLAAYSPRLAGTLLSTLYERNRRLPALPDIAQYAIAYWRDYHGKILQAAIESMQAFRPKPQWQERAKNIYRHFLADMFAPAKLAELSVSNYYFIAPYSLSGFLQPFINYSYMTPLTSHDEFSEIDDRQPLVLALAPGLPHVPLSKPKKRPLHGVDVLDKARKFFEFAKPYYLSMVEAGVIDDDAQIAGIKTGNAIKLSALLQKPIGWLRNKRDS